MLPKLSNTLLEYYFLCDIINYLSLDGHQIVTQSCIHNGHICISFFKIVLIIYVAESESNKREEANLYSHNEAEHINHSEPTWVYRNSTYRKYEAY